MPRLQYLLGSSTDVDVSATNPLPAVNWLSTAPASGELVGTLAATQLPNVPCRLVRLKALSTNAGKVYLGVSASVTKSDGATDTTTGLQLAAGDDTGWIPTDNVNRFWRICDNVGDALTYLALN